MIHHVHLEERPDGWDAYFAVRLENVVVFDPSQGEHGEFAFSLLNRQIDLINSLEHPEDGRVVNLRYLCHPDPVDYRRGHVEVFFLCRIPGKTREQAQERAGGFFRDFWAAVNSVSEHYDFSPVVEEGDFLKLFRPFEIRSVAEIARREDLIETGSARRIRGFQRGEAQAKPPEGSIYYIYPYIWGLSTMERTLAALLRSPAPTMVSVILKPVAYTENVRQLFEEQIERIDTGPRNARVHQRMEEIQKTLKVQLLRIEDAPFLVKTFIASPGTVAKSLIDSFGVDVTEHSGAPDILKQVKDDYHFSGGYDWFEYEGTEEKARALEEMERVDCLYSSPTIAPPSHWEIRHLFDSAQASCAFRLPVPTPRELPGIGARYYKKGVPPTSVGAGDVTLGVARRDGRSDPIGQLNADRPMHTYVVGQTGTGKSTLLLNMIVQDIERGAGLCVLDPHGELVDKILPRVPRERMDDVIYVNLEDIERPIGLNMLEADGSLEKDQVVQLLFEIFDKMYDLKATGGPIFEMYMKLALYTALADPDHTPTILDVQRIFIDKEFRDALLKKVDDPYLRKSWGQVVEQAGGEMGLRNIVPYITSKLSMFVYNTTIRNIVSQRKSTVVMRDVIEDGKILLVDLCKGKIGPLFSNFLGMVIISKTLLSVLGRGGPERRDGMRPFFLYVDEFQNLATDSFATLLSEARKYNLCAVLANQYLTQIPENIRDAISGNVGSLVTFRLGVNDSEIIEREFFPTFSKHDLMNIPNWKACVKMLWRGDKMSPFEIDTLPPYGTPDPAVVPEIVRNSRERYGRAPEPPPAPGGKDEILFIGKGCEEKGYQGSSEDGSISYFAGILSSVHANARGKVLDFFTDSAPPKMIRLRFAKDVVIPLEEESEQDEEIDAETGTEPDAESAPEPDTDTEAGSDTGEEPVTS